MAYTANTKSSSNFKTKLYSGTNSSNTQVVGFKPTLTWIKKRSGDAEHCLFDTLRGALYHIRSNDVDTSSSLANSLSAFNSNGFTVLSADQVNDGSDTYASWNWKGGTTGSGNTSGSGTAKAYNYDANATAGFSTVKYVGNGTAGHTIPHHLGAAPKAVWVKTITGSNSNWSCFHVSTGGNRAMALNTDGGEGSSNSAFWNGTSPGTSVVTLGNGATVNNNGSTYIMYVFVEKPGYSKINYYLGNGNANGPVQFTGFKVQWLLRKNLADNSSKWIMHDSSRGINTNTVRLQANGIEDEDSSDGVDLLSNCFKPRSGGASGNANGAYYLYIAFGQSMVGTNNVPATAS